MKIILTVILLLTASHSFGQDSELKPLDLMLTNYDYPYAVNYLNFSSQQQDLVMAYMDVKPDVFNGKTIMLLHGKNFNGAYWKTTIEALNNAGYRVIVPDQIGFGKSSKPDHYQFTFQQLAKNTKLILDTLGIEKTFVLGHSMGGMLATRFALMYPETTEKLILENPIGLEDWKTVVPYQTIDWWYQSELNSSYDKIKAYQLANYYDNKWKDEYDEWVNLLAGWTLDPDYAKIAWNSALTYDMIFTQPVIYEFKDLTCPVLLIIGTRDRTALGKPLVPEDVRKTMGLYDQLGKSTQKLIPNCELIEIQDIGHMPHIENFDAFIGPLLSFLN
ncbi:MAG TPA: alpha/beta hydrolase [Ignavibacteria bacterium]|nr:alpha/beta hydrolase [Ignavibacteria bacterium]